MNAYMIIRDESKQAGHGTKSTAEFYRTIYAIYSS
jgi:hypothetical protein